MKQKVIVDNNQSANSSFGLYSDISAILNDSQLINSSSELLTLSAMDNLIDVENGVHSNSQNVKRSRRNIKKKEYSEGACNDADYSSLSEDDDVDDPNFCPKVISGSISDSDGENPYVPKKKAKIEVNSATILQSTPKRRGRGRPKGAINKVVPGANNKKGKGHKIQKKTSSRKKGKAKGKKGDTNVADDTDMVDDKENNPSQELIANFRIYGTSKGETGCNSPVKKNIKEK